MNRMKRILILSANPRGTTQLRLDEEVREIEEGLRRSKHRDQFVIHSKWATRLRDLRRAMLDYAPHIVHFCGHGEGDGLVMEGESGNAILVSPEALSGLFELFVNQVECVLLNACYSTTQAKAINEYIPYVVGMSKGIQDRTAIEFAVGFYDALGAGKPVEDAFKFGRNAAQFANTSEYETPVLRKKPSLLKLSRRTIAVVCPLFGASRIYYTELLSAIIEQANKHGYELLIVPITDTAFKRPLVSHFPQISSVAGVILITCQIEGSNWLDECASRNLPVVLLHDNIPENEARGYTVVSHIRPRLNALADLVQHLIVRHSCRNISVVAVDPGNHEVRLEKISIIERAIREAQLSFSRERNVYCIKEYSYEQGIFVADRIIETKPDTDAIICLADVTAIGIIQRLNELGLHNQIRVTGFDNVEVASQNDLATVDQELRLTGERALTDLHDAIQRQSFSEFQTISYVPTTFVPRKSCCFTK